MKSLSVRQSRELVNLELDRGLTLARFCRGCGPQARSDDLGKAKAACQHAFDLLAGETRLTLWQRRALNRKLRRLEECIREVEIAGSGTQFASAPNIPFPAASISNVKP